MDSIAYLSDLETDTKAWWKTGDGKLYLLHPIQSHAIASIGTSSPRIDATTLQSAIDQCRVIKDDYEINLIRQANKVSADAHHAVLDKIKSFENESQVEGIFLDTCVSEGAHNQAYNIIAGSGSNASVLHYGKNDEPLAGRQVLLIDAGAEWNCYASDVTRTFPISGTWTKEAKAIYDIVEKMQDTVISRLKPGVHYRDMQVLAHVIAANGLLELGILHNGTAAEILNAGTTLAFFPHGLGHHVGLEVHDVLNIRISTEEEQERHSAASQTSSLYFQLNHTDLKGRAVCTSAAFLASNASQLYATLNDPGICMAPAREDSPTLKQGMVITVEPGIYFSKFALENHFLKDPVHSQYINKDVLERYMDVGGVRIEDDILLTKNGFENLTTAPKGEDALRIIRGEKEYPALNHLPMRVVERKRRCNGYQEKRLNKGPDMDIAHPRYAHDSGKQMEKTDTTCLPGYQAHLARTADDRGTEESRASPSTSRLTCGITSSGKIYLVAPPEGLDLATCKMVRDMIHTSSDIPISSPIDGDFELARRLVEGRKTQGGVMERFVDERLEEDGWVCELGVGDGNEEVEVEKRNMAGDCFPVSKEGSLMGGFPFGGK